jgi:hypothetical protein
MVDAYQRPPNSRMYNCLLALAYRQGLGVQELLEIGGRVFSALRRSYSNSIYFTGLAILEQQKLERISTSS